MLERFVGGGSGWLRRARLLLGLLDREAAALRAARIAEIAEIAQRRDALLAELEAATPPEGPETEALLARIRRQAGRNQGLARAVLDGLRAARADLDRIGAATGQIGLYGPSGGRLTEPSTNPLSDRRA